MAASDRRKPTALSRVRDASRSPKPALYVKKVRGMGRGVFAGRRYRKGEVIEFCPVVPMTRREERKCRGGVLDRYFFAWDEPGYVVAVVLGYGCVYNTSPNPNARFTQRWATGDMVYRAARDIEPGEQIFVNYGWAPGEFDIPADGRRTGRKSARAARGPSALPSAGRIIPLRPASHRAFGHGNS